MNRVASVKAASQASKYFNGSQLTSDYIIRTIETSNLKVETQIIEEINEHSSGYINMLEMITSFSDDDNNMVFIFGKKLETITEAKTRKCRNRR